jgi:hypothetical protein
MTLGGILMRLFQFQNPSKCSFDNFFVNSINQISKEIKYNKRQSKEQIFSSKVIKDEDRDDKCG